MMIKQQPTDEELMLAYQRGEAQAFEELFARYRTRLFTYLRRAIGDPVQAEDLLQTLFLRVHRARGISLSISAYEKKKRRYGGSTTVLLRNDGRMEKRERRDSFQLKPNADKRRRAAGIRGASG